MPHPAPTTDDPLVDSLDHALRDVDGGPPTDDRLLAMVESQLFSSTRSQPATLDRYEIKDRLGAGGMGVVYRAHDPELSRDVAIKLLHQRTSRTSSARTRLRQEARALADVSHPNVVQVYDVGTEPESNAIYISMELVLGVDLRQWLEAEPRPWRPVLEMFLAAGRGLAAAHDRGLVHRDFKPSNVLVGRDGRPRVVDFGLACVADDSHTKRSARSTTTSGLSGAALTETGVALGTPAYMAPEQHQGRGADARSDQYAFCMSLYEGLYGVRPFKAHTVQDLLVAKTQHRISSVWGRGVPRSVLAVLRRGLQPDRQHRFVTMAELLAKLEAVAHGGRSRRLVAGLAFGAVGTAGAAAWAMHEDPQQVAVCPPAAERLAGVWDDARRTELRGALTGSGLTYAQATWSRLESHMDGYAVRWGDAYDSTCAEMQHPPADTTPLDRRMACLTSRRDELATLIDVLINSESAAVPKAVAAVTGLRPISRCDHPEVMISIDGNNQAAVDEIRRDLLKAESLGKVARYDDGLTLALAAQQRAEALDVPALRSEALLVRGQLTKGLGQVEPAERLLNESALLATSLGHDPVVATAATELVNVLGAWSARHDEALEWDRRADAAIDRLDGDPVLEAERLTARGNLELNLGHIDMALAQFEQSLQMRRRTFGEGHPSLAAARSSMGDVLNRAGRFDEALVAAREAVALGERALGADHPSVGIMHTRLATARIRQGDYTGAAQAAARSAEILSAALGPKHPNVAAAMISQGQAEQRRGRLDQAETIYKHALSLVPGTANAVIVTAILSDLARDRQDYAAALTYATQSRESREALYGSNDTRVAIGLMVEGLALAQAEHDTDAFAAFERAQSMTAEQPLAAPVQAVFTAYRGRAHLYGGRPAEAVPLLEQAIGMQKKLGAEPLDIAEVRFSLVQALWQLDRARDALAQLRVVDLELAPMGEEAEHRRTPIRAWIEREHIDYTMAISDDPPRDAPAPR